MSIDPTTHGMYRSFTLPEQCDEKISFGVIRDRYNNGGPRYWRTVEMWGSTIVHQAPMGSRDDAEILADVMNKRSDVQMHNASIC